MMKSSLGKILIVDDEVELKNVLCEALASQGYETAGFTSGEKALAALRAQAFDVLLTDLMMPEMDGITLVKESLLIDPHLVCMVMTGQGTIQTAVDAMKEGAFDYVVKPFRLQTVLPVLTRAMNTRHLRLENIQLREAVAIHELSETIAFTLDPKTVLSKLADAALRQSEADEVSVLLPEDGDHFYVAVVRGEKHERLLGERIPFDDSIASWVAREREPLLLNGEVHDERFTTHWPRPEINSSVSIPMLVAQKLVGVLTLNVINKPRPFTLGQMKALTILAGTAAAALESASLYMQIENQRQRLDNIVANVPGVVWEAWGQPDAATQRIDFVSHHVEAMLGYTVAEWLSTPNFWLTIVHPDDKERAGRMAGEAFAQGQNATLEFRWVAKDGQAIWVESNFVVIKDDEGLSVGLRGVNTDISARKRADERQTRRAAHALFRADVSAALASRKSALQDTLKLCAEAMVHHLNAAFARVWTFNRKESVLELQASAGLYTLTDGADARVPLGSFKIGRIAEQRLPHISNDVPNDPEVSNQEWATREGMVAFAGYPLIVEDRLLGVMALFSREVLEEDTLDALASVADIVSQGIERQRAEAALRESEERYRELFESNPYPMWVFDLETLRFLAVNDAAVSHYGYSRDEFLRLTIAEIRPAEDVPQFMKDLAKGPPTVITEARHCKKDGTVIDVAISSQTLLFAKRKAQLVLALDITVRKEAEVALRESEERYRDLVENALDIIYTHDLKGNYTSTNKAGEAITGYTLAESMQMNLADTVAPEYLERARKMTARKIAGEHVTAYELEIIAKDGRRIPIEVNTRLQVENGVPVGIQGIARDITERKEAEAELRFQKSLLESQSEASIDGMLVVSPSGEVLSFNQRFLEIWDLPEQGVSGKLDYVVLQAALDRVADADEFAARVNYLYAHPDESSDEEIALKDGRTLERHSAPVHGPQGEYYGRVWFFRDITQRKTAQAELTQLATAVEQTGDSIVITDINGNIEYVNPAFERITGYTKEEALGQNPRILKSGRTDPAVYRDLWETIVRGGVWSGQLINQKKDGTFFNERATISAVLDESGKITHYIAVKQDTTHETQLEEQLRQSQKMEAIGQLAGGVAHDFNNLLTAINGYSGLALQRIEAESPLKPYIEEIKKAGDRAANLTRQLLAFGRKQMLQPLPLNLNDVITDLNKMLRRLIGEDIRLAARLDLDLKRIKADPGQIEQVLVNLVVNARDAMPRGGSLTIETANIQVAEEYASRHIGVSPGAYVMLAVSDTGTGMDVETQAKLFEPFFTTKEKGKGTGLGLSTVYGIVKQSGGNIWVYSELGHGSTFKIYLPQVDDPVKKVQAKAEDDLMLRGSETVLLVEDEEVVRGLAQRILEEAGYRVISASGGKEAVNWCTNNAETIHLLLTDVVMPETSGKELAERLSSLRPQTKVLFMSGYTDEAIVHHGVLDSNVEFIQKPFSPTALSRKVRQVLDSNGHSK